MAEQAPKLTEDDARLMAFHLRRMGTDNPALGEVAQSVAAVDKILKHNGASWGDLAANPQLLSHGPQLLDSYVQANQQLAQQNQMVLAENNTLKRMNKALAFRPLKSIMNFCKKPLPAYGSITFQVLMTLGAMLTGPLCFVTSRYVYAREIGRLRRNNFWACKQPANNNDSFSYNRIINTFVVSFFTGFATHVCVNIHDTINKDVNTNKAMSAAKEAVANCLQSKRANDLPSCDASYAPDKTFLDHVPLLSFYANKIVSRQIVAVRSYKVTPIFNAAGEYSAKEVCANTTFFNLDPNDFESFQQRASGARVPKPYTPEGQKPWHCVKADFTSSDLAGLPVSKQIHRIAVVFPDMSYAMPTCTTTTEYKKETSPLATPYIIPQPPVKKCTLEYKQ